MMSDDNYDGVNPATGLLTVDGIDTAGNPLGAGGYIHNIEYDHESFQALPLWLRLAHYAALASVFAFIFWMIFERGIL
jgi:hypothetical protein